MHMYVLNMQLISHPCQNSCPASHNNYYIIFLYTALPVTVRFAQDMYLVNEAAPSRNLVLSVCVIASTTERSFSVTVSPVSGTAVGKHLP